MVAGFGFFRRLLADFGDLGQGKVTGVKQIVDVGQAEPELTHEGTTVLVVAFADFRQRGAGGLPYALGEGKCTETGRWRVVQILL